MAAAQDNPRAFEVRTAAVQSHAPRARQAFTLIETLVVTTIIAVLIAILMPALNSARGQMRALKCLSNLRSLAFKFQLFADGQNAEGRGDSELLGGGRFYANDFQESVYHIQEFWDQPGLASAPISARNELMMCPAGAAQLKKQSGYPCSVQAISPAKDVSTAMNMRLFRIAIDTPNGPGLSPAFATHIRADILGHPYVPMLLDVDGQQASVQGVPPFYTAPPLSGSADAYSSGAYWMPGMRHRGMTHVAFVGGHVLGSRRPEHESWDWSYQAEVGN
ncbi:MAG TPA: type II secretion system protein [Phycisphaerae bacterium]|jgi:prepilin-type N-terminal cleavage/methylation domain-containing protein/prepilin-type processing-associated H-X9-DG protein